MADWESICLAPFPPADRGVPRDRDWRISQKKEASFLPWQPGCPTGPRIPAHGNVHSGAKAGKPDSLPGAGPKPT